GGRVPPGGHRAPGPPPAPLRRPPGPRPLGPASAAPGPAAPPASPCPRRTSRSATPRTPGPCANPPPVDSRSRQNEKPRPGQPLTVYCRGMFEVPLDGLKEGICAVGPVTAEPSKPRPDEKQERRQCAQPVRS